MIVSKEIILKIELSGDDLKNFKSLFENIIAADVSANQGLGFLKNEEKKYVENILKIIENG